MLKNVLRERGKKKELNKKSNVFTESEDMVC